MNSARGRYTYVVVGNSNNVTRRQARWQLLIQDAAAMALRGTGTGRLLDDGRFGCGNDGSESHQVPA